jgi:adenylate cyclase
MGGRFGNRCCSPARYNPQHRPRIIDFPEKREKRVAQDPKVQREFLVGVCIAVVVAALAMLVLARTPAGVLLENGTLDERARLGANPAQADPRIVIIDIDNASLEALEDKLGRWPWTRRVWTEVIRYVNRGQPKVIAVDAIFGGAESDAVDQEFGAVMHQGGNTVLGFTFVPTEMEESGASASQKLAALFAHRAAADANGAAAYGAPIDAKHFLPNLPAPVLVAGAAGLGALNALPDSDGVMRSVGVEMSYGGHAYDSLDSRAVEQALGAPVLWNGNGGLLGGHYAIVAGRRIPVGEDGRILLAWRGGSSVYPRLPIWQVICSIYPTQCPPDVQHYPPGYFTDKIVLIGASATASYDVHPTPFASAAPGVVVHATAVDDLLNGTAIRISPFWLLAVLTILMAAAGGAVLFLMRQLARSVIVVIALEFVYLAVCLIFYEDVHVALPVAAPGLALLISFGAATAARYVTTGRQLRQTRGMLDRYMSPQLVEYVIANLGDLKLSGDKRELTILVSDVRNFTTMTEGSDPLELIALLDEYFAAMTEIIFRHNGIVDKFIGDGILAYWGAFTPQINHAAEAAKAAVEMIDRVKELNKTWAAQGRQTIAIGVGVNTGTVIFGNIGKGKKIEFTVIGDAVNLAARLEGLNKEFGTSIIVSEFTQQRIAGEARTRPLGGYRVKGKTVETAVFALEGWGAVDAAEKSDSVTV